MYLRGSTTFKIVFKKKKKNIILKARYIKTLLKSPELFFYSIKVAISRIFRKHSNA